MRNICSYLLFRQNPLEIPAKSICAGLLAGVLAVPSPLYADEVSVQLGATPPSDAIALSAHGIDSAIKQLPDSIRGVMKRSGVPGVAVAVVHNGKTVFAKGFGVREL